MDRWNEDCYLVLNTILCHSPVKYGIAYNTDITKEKHHRSQFELKKDIPCI